AQGVPASEGRPPPGGKRQSDPVEPADHARVVVAPEGRGEEEVRDDSRGDDRVLAARCVVQGGTKVRRIWAGTSGHGQTVAGHEDALAKEGGRGGDGKAPADAMLD